MEKVQVLLSTYNGEKYLCEQLDSVLAQECVEVSILIRDDGSTDGTINILQKYSLKYDNVKYYQGDNLKTAKSFLELISVADESPYYALCDQDDVWDKDKLIRAINLLKKMNNNVPLLYHSNVRVVDKDLNFIRLLHSHHWIQNSKYTSLLEPMLLGCTGVFNLQTKKYVSRCMPRYCSMHDTWIYMVCMILGNVFYDPLPHMSYRQHSANVIGVYLTLTHDIIISKLKKMLDKKIQPRFYNAISFYECFHDLMTQEDAAKIKKIIHYKDSWYNTFSLLIDRDLWATSVVKDLRNKFRILARII